MQTVIEKIKSLKIKRIGCACLLLALLPAVAAAGAQTLDEQVDRIFRDAKTVGGAFLVAQEGEIVYERYYGEQQKTTHVPVTEKSYFRCASVTKLVTGIGLMRMMDDGLLDPDENISVYLGYEAGNPRYPDVPITLRMLMSHTSGLNENSSYSRLSSKLSDMIALDKKAAANFKDVRPGSQYAYSNFGAGVTGAIIESVTGQDVSSFMREYLFAPLGIDAAYTATQLEEAETYLTATYHKDGSLYRAPSYLLRQAYDAFATPDTHYRVTVGSLLIRPRDLTRLGIALCGDGTVDGPIARKALTALENTYFASDGVLEAETARGLTQRSGMRFDTSGDEHYDLLSAFQKSIRGSDENAAVFYLARILEGGDLLSACRRLMVCACEDVGLAYPTAATVVKSCVDIALAVGLPEAYLPLAEAVILLATSPKSNSAMCAYQAALEDVRAGRGAEMPSYLRDAHFAAGAVRGKAYRYPHEYPNGYVRQQYLPDELKDRVYYRFGRNRTEQAAREYRERLLREADGKAEP